MKAILKSEILELGPKTIWHNMASVQFCSSKIIPPEWSAVRDCSIVHCMAGIRSVGVPPAGGRHQGRGGCLISGPQHQGGVQPASALYLITRAGHATMF